MNVRVPDPITPPFGVYVAHAAGRTDPAALARGVELLGGAGVTVSFNGALGLFDAGADPLVDATGCLRSRSLDFLSGPDLLRARDLVHGLSDPAFAAVIAARGGYGAMRVVERVPARLLDESPRWLVGYSDITTLHLWAYAQGVASLHGPMAASLAKHGDDASLDALLDALAGRPHALPAAAHAWAAAADQIRGPLVGGNLSLLAALRPTRLWPALDGAILFIEEVGEPLYRVDRMLQTLKLAGGLERVAAFAIGQLSGCGGGALGGGDEEQAALELVVERLAPYERPILVGLPVGHGAPNLAFVHGAPYAFDGDALVYAPSRTRVTAPRRAVAPLSWVLSEAVSSGVAPGLQLHVSRRDEVVADEALGFTAWTDDAARAPVAPETLFDLASVTKAIATAVLAHQAIDEGRVALDQRCPRDLCVAEPALIDLLRHTSGLPAYRRVWVEARQHEAPRTHALEAFAGVAGEPPGHEVYSDLGYVALGRWLERLLGGPLDALFDERIAAPIGIDDELGFGATTNRLAAIAATERCPYRSATLQGVVHDENCQVLGGVAGHAGLFGTARAVGALARSLLGFGPPVLSAAGVARMWSTEHRVGSYTLGWDTPSGPRSNAGSRMTRSATVGHLGFTGTSLWIDRRAEVVVVLNTNRVHPTRDNAGIRWLRPAVHDAVMAELEANAR